MLHCLCVRIIPSPRCFIQSVLLMALSTCIVYYTLKTDTKPYIQGIMLSNFTKIKKQFHKNNMGSRDTSASSRQIHVHYYNPPPLFKEVGEIFLGCPSNCSVSIGNNQNYYDKDAVIFYTRFLPKTPVKKRPGQIWVFYNKEPMWERHKFAKAYNGLFNWTLTYRRDSDILRTYGRFEHRPLQSVRFPNMSSKFSSFIDPERRSSRKKRSSTAWFVSHCPTHSKRADYVEILKRTHDVDIYGRCGTYSCKKGDFQCLDMLSEKYKFYLAFENSLYKDYITEKSFRLYEHYIDVIPVTRAFHDLYSMYLPPGSYIDASRFHGIKELGQFLNDLGKNPKKYIQYFQWRNDYHAHGYNYWCDLCDRLHDPNVNTKYQRIYHDFYNWMYGSPVFSSIEDPRDIRN